MFGILLRTNRQSSNHVFYFLNLLFLLHICTAFLTIVNALNNNDNEAIIQLSVDSIHVVKSSDSRFANIEENANDDDEKELLIALLTSFDDDYKSNKQNYLDKSSDYDASNKESSATKNCTPATETVSSSSSSIRFIPSVLDFGEQAIAIPRMETVMIINDDSEAFELHSLSGTTVQFYSSFFTQKTLPANGGNTTINVYYLPRTGGLMKSTFTIKTNRGTLHYSVSGIGTVNPFHIRPLTGATIPFNSTFEHLIHFYNPYNYSIDINEIYTSDENLIIELISYKNQKNKITKAFEHNEQWHLEPYRTKAIVKIYYHAHKLDRLHGFYCIKANTNETIIAPVEITVSEQENLYSNVDIIEFNAQGTIHSTARSTTVPVHVINNGRSPVTVTSIRVTTGNLNYITVHYEKVQVPSGVHHLTKIAELTIHPHLIPKDIKHIRGSVQIYTLTSFNTEELTLQIPFRARFIYGSLDYDKESTYIYIPSSPNQQTQNECQPIKLISRFQIPIIIYNITTDKADLLAQYIHINFNSSYVMIQPEQRLSSICVNILKSSSPSTPFANLEATLTLHTNLSFFHLPIYLYSGSLSINLPNDNTNGGIRRNDTYPLEYFIASIPVNEIRTVHFILINTNPMEISIEQISFTLPRTTLQLVEMETLNGSETTVSYRIGYQKDNLVKLVIPARHRAVISLSINGSSDPSFYHETITFKTRYETLNMNVKYQIVSGSIELENKQPLHIDVFPNHLGTIDIIVHNKFDEPIDVLRIEFATFGKCLSFVWNNTSPGKLIIDTNQTHRIGKLTFDMIPLCNSIQTLSESTCYCGINNHPEFKQRWEQHVTELNNNELDHFLVTKFRNLWKEWTSLVRKQRLHTNIWLVTDQANVSWPVSVSFVWPSVLEHMSTALTRTPVILDFHLTLIDTIKTQNVIITNPSSTIVQYSIELTSTNGNPKTKRQIGSTNSISTFAIASISKRVEVSDNIYRFSLLSNEHIIFTASYRPKQLLKHEMYLVIRNNLTIIESILLRGEGGSGSLTVGNRKSGSSDIPLVLEMNEKQYKLCSNFPSADGTRGNPILQKIVTLRNTGNMKTVIQEISFGQSKCSGQGFSVSTCSDIEIDSNDRYDLRIRFQPDYTLAEIEETLTLNTNMGVMTFPILVRIPQRVLATCYRNIPRPVWEPKVYWFCLCSIVILLLCILTYAVFDAYRLYNDYVARAELRARMPITSPSLVDLTDLTAAVQDEQRNRERIESRTSTSSMNNNKKEETKPKEELKPKRSNPSTNGETSSKTSRMTDGSNTPVRSVATSPKASTNKQRRLTADYGSTKPSKHQHETSSKPSVLRAQKSNNTEPSTAVTSRSPTPPSTAAVTDDENEPFTLARSKRVSGKTKEPTTNVIPIKSTSTPESASPLPSVTVLPKPSSRSELSEQRQHQQDLSRSTDSLSDQQWHMVSSNRGIRKTTTATTNRREPADESQPLTKTSKPPATNPENPVVSSASSQPHASISNSMAQSRRRRGRRLTRPLSPSPLSNSPTRPSFPSKNPNRELAFRQLTEQLWAAGLPSSRTACSMSVRSRCSSAPPSERGGGGAENDLTRIDWEQDDDEENGIEWDAPGRPDEDFGRYVSQAEQSSNETNGINEWSPPTPPASILNDIPTFQPVAATPSPSVLPKKPIPSSIIKDDMEPLPFHQHGPGPIQRPNKLAYPSPQQSTLLPPSYLPNKIQAPSTPEVLYQINRLLEQQNNPPSTASTASNVSASSGPISDLSTPNTPWTTFAPTEWSSKYDSSWPMTDMQSSPMPMAAPVQNPFGMMSTMGEQQQQRVPSNEEVTVWSTALGTATPRLVSSSARTQRASAWNDIFQSTVPSSTELNKSTTNSWLWSVPDAASANARTTNGHETNANHSIWSLETLSNEPAISSAMPNPQQVSATGWWSNSTSDENNNTSQANHLNDDPSTNRDQSRWDFAR